MQVRILKPTKSPMQAGDGNDKWILEFVKIQDSRFREELMARTSSSDMMSEVRLEFNSLALAEKHAKENNYSYEIVQPKPRRVFKRSYTDNFT